MKKRYLVTSALPYANGPLHIGHLTGAYLPADIYVRYLRLMGKDVVYVCGSDEHGAAITIRARKEGVSPREIVDKYHALIRDSFEKIGIAFDIYHRTSAPLHHQTSQDFFRKLLENGQFEEKESEQYFDEEAQQFLADRYIIGTCPVCANPDAYGDQCEKCGSTLSPTQLINPRSTLSGSAPVLKPTTHWYLKLDEHEAWLREWINTGKADGIQLHDPAAWKNHVIGQCNSWLDQGLQPRAMTRDLDWGVDVPPELPGAKGKKLYVWLDAPIGYISATKQWATDHHVDWEPYWKSEDTALVHFIGKDNIVFHCLIFPAILKAHGDFILPVNVPANQFMNLEGDKISTSRNWAVWVHEYLEELPGREDELRYNMVKNMPEQRDSEFTWKGFQESTNTELVGNLAGFLHRVQVLVHKNYTGVVPAFDINREFKSGWNADTWATFDSEVHQIHLKLEEMGREIERFNFREALRILMEISSAGNALLQFNEPWKLVHEDPELVKVVLNLGLQYAAVLSVAMQPFLPFASARLRSMLNLGPLAEDRALLDIHNELAEGNPIIRPNHALNTAEHLFTRIPDELIETQIQKLQASAAATPATAKTQAAAPEKTVEPLKAMIQYDDFAKLDIRTGTILEATKVEKADKLLRLTVDLGFEKRTIVSGIALHFDPEAIIGKQVLVLANLAPRKMRGIESEGMILMAEDADGKLGFVSPDAGWPAGSKVS
ncbi:MAG: methionine--tRNA ligase [Lewinellaceae bacterium]|nr:methionine--tRNA ligase [Saprospiraceae bacterium]MCB9332139.1 methionine--tRNA ligase [Lewinellaceae bacterium]